MNPEEKDELEEVAHRIQKSNRWKGIIAGLLAGLLFVVADVGATLYALRQSTHNGKVTVAAERGLRCILRDAREDQPESDQQKLFNRCYQEFDRLVQEQEDP